MFRNYRNFQPLCDPVTHLKNYPIKRVSPGKDQLPPTAFWSITSSGSNNWNYKPVGLMVPSTKGLATPPLPPSPNAFSYEHYKCYEVTGGKPIKQVVPPSPPVRHKADRRRQGHGAVQPGREAARRGNDQIHNVRPPPGLLRDQAKGQAAGGVRAQPVRPRAPEAGPGQAPLRSLKQVLPCQKSR